MEQNGPGKDLLANAVDLVLSLVGSNMPQDEVSSSLCRVYDVLVKGYRPLIRAVPAITDKAVRDLMPVFVGIMQAVDSASNDPDFLQALEKSRTTKARSRKADLDIYVEAGFTRDEAMSLLLLDVANTGAQVQQWTSRVDFSKLGRRPE